MKKVTVFLIFLTVWCSGCVRDDLAECPPLQIMVEVIDKNYENIADAEALGSGCTESGRFAISAVM